ncbi:orotidine-5'-phosphate decarboxylase [Candidatus Bathyarchaeota archaeon]|nr:orotidine-5'-phosphate decarboxylase [Candidatus Bathyarchaeota archaeon]
MLGRGFVQRYVELSRDKESFLCVGLDPVTEDIRQRYIVPPPLIKRCGLVEGIKRFCLEIVEAVSSYTPMVKPNLQFLAYPLSLDDMREIVEAIHDGGCLALLDAKLTDIGSTNEAGLHWISHLGFDAVTFSPFPGFRDGCDIVYEWARRLDRGIFALCKMSNPGSGDYQSLMVEGEPLYIRLARDAHNNGCNGFVVGGTATSELEAVRSIIGEERLILSPGLGPQGGDPTEAFRRGANREGERLILASSRSINYAYEILGWSWERFAEAAAAQADRIRREFNEIRKKATEAL